jgi:hypothetical protein
MLYIASILKDKRKELDRPGRRLTHRTGRTWNVHPVTLSDVFKIHVYLCNTADVPPT